MATADHPTKVYKILTPDEWRDWRLEGVFKGAGIDIRDGYIHLSTEDQVVETYDKFFNGKDVVLVSVDLTKVADEIKWEPSRNEELFPHVYGKLDMDACTSFKEAWDGSKPDVNTVTGFR